MKRLVFLAIAALALAVPALTTARGVPHNTLSLTAGAPSVVTGDSLTLSGTLLDEHHHGIVNAKVTFLAFSGHKVIPLGSVMTGAMGKYSKPTTVTLTPGVYKLQAMGPFAMSTLVPLIVKDKVEVVAPAENGVFLCYSLYQSEPGVWPVSEALGLVTAGYWQPFAVSGNVTGGTNLGAYHLTCNLATGQSVADVHGYTGPGGEVYGADLHDAFASTLGMYPIAE